MSMTAPSLKHRFEKLLYTENHLSVGEDRGLYNWNGQFQSCQLNIYDIFIQESAMGNDFLTISFKILKL